MGQGFTVDQRRVQHAVEMVCHTQAPETQVDVLPDPRVHKCVLQREMTSLPPST